MATDTNPEVGQMVPLGMAFRPLPSTANKIMDAVAHHQKMGRTVQQANLPGLWNVTGFPELTTGQLLSIAAEGR